MKTVETDTVTRTPFPDRLSAIRLSAGQETARNEHRRRNAERLTLQRRVAGLEFVERVEADIQAMLDDLVTELGLTPRRVHRLFDGRFQVGLRWDDPASEDDPRAGPQRSRVTLLLDPRSDDGRFHLEMRATVRGRDLPSDVLEVAVDAEGRQALGAFVQERLLTLARAYLGGRSLSRAG